MPDWVQQGCSEYLKRLPREWMVQLQELTQARLGKNPPPSKVLSDEASRIQAALNPAARLIALDVKGQSFSTEQLSQQVQNWQQDGRDIELMIGGPEGLEQTLLDHAEQRWSLSCLTLPHPLVRIVVLEQLYRVWSLLHNHPYHRA